MRRFELGRVVATPSALAMMDCYDADPAELLDRHQSGDWGEVCAADARENERSVKNGWRVLSVYEINGRGASVRIWVITESDRSSTCILLPEDY